MTNAAIMIALISPISTFKTLPNSNFSFGEVEGFDAHCFFIINGIFFFLLHLYRCYYCHQYTFFRLFIYSFVSIIRIIAIVITSIRFSSFIYSFNFFPQSAKQPVSKTHPTYFRKAEEIGMRTRMSVTLREVTQSPSKLKKNGSLSVMRFKSVVLRILVRGTLVQRRSAEFGLGRVEKN